MRRMRLGRAAALALLFLGCAPTQSSHPHDATTSSGSGTGASAPLCTDCSDDAQCQSGFCDLVDPEAGRGFCDSTNPCEADADCEGRASCDLPSGACACPQLGGAGASTGSGSSSGSGTGTSSQSSTGAGTATSSTGGGTTGGAVCTPCTVTSQCGTGHCLKQSGGTSYYCGADCTTDANVCPSGWICDALSSGKSGCRAVAPTCP